MMHVITDDDRGEMMDGLFYYLEPFFNLHDYDLFCDKEESKLNHQPEIVHSSGGEEEYHYLHICNYSYESKKISQCSLNKKHSFVEIYKKFELIDLNSGAEGAFIPFEMLNDTIIIKEDVKKHFDKVGFTGGESIPVKNSFTFFPIDFKMVLLNSPTPPPYRKSRVIPDSENACPYCGISPVCCPECDAIDEHCRNCGEKTLFTSKENGELGFYIEYNDKSLGDIGAMGRPYPYLDGSLWNGSDFMSGNIVTGRVRDYCVKNKLGPVVFWKMNTYVGSCTPAQRQKLEAIRSKNP